MTRARRLRLALGLNLGLVVGQVVVGAAANSLGLLSDAGHNLADAAAVVASIVAIRLSGRSATPERSYGLHRATILAALGNAAGVLAVALLIAYEGVRRAMHPEPVSGALVVAAASLALVANAGSAVALRDRSRDLNMRSALLHAWGDTLAALGVVAAGAVILATGHLQVLDPAVSIGIALLIAIQAWRLLRACVEVLLEATPEGMDLDLLVVTMGGVSGVDSVHDLHVWSLSSEVRAMSAHLVLAGHPSLEEAQVVGERVKREVATRFAISHSTLELECEQCPTTTPCAIEAVPGLPSSHGHPLN